MLQLRLFISIVLGALLMGGLSYVWHGVILNDLLFITNNKILFLGLSALMYLLISGGFVFVMNLYNPKENVLMTYFTAGIVAGFGISLIALILGFSFSGHGASHIIVNFLWQMAEQGSGAFLIGLYTLAMRNRDEFLVSSSRRSA